MCSEVQCAQMIDDYNMACACACQSLAGLAGWPRGSNGAQTPTHQLTWLSKQLKVAMQWRRRLLSLLVVFISAHSNVEPGAYASSLTSKPLFNTHFKIHG